MVTPRRGLVAVGLTAAIAFGLAVLAPLRPISGDTVPGRLGALVLRCGGGFDLARVDWIRAAARLPYWAQRDGDRIVSVYGPAPAVIGAVALLEVSPGDVVDDTLLRRRERGAAALLVALAAALLALATAARHGPMRSVATGLVAAASFAGAATLGQGLWQQSVALPWLVGALATLAWRARMPRAAVVTPGLLIVALLIRPTLAPLVLGLGAAWSLETRRDGRMWLAATAIAIAAAVPLVAWNVVHLGTPLPVGQWRSNAHVADHVFVLSRAQLGYGLGGLLVSPGRGLLWFAPIALVGIVRAIRLRDVLVRIVAASIVLQILVIAMFHMWWGGACYGPRFLAEATWLAIWLALGSSVELAALRRWTVVAAGVTIVVGQLGLWRWRAEQWEARRNPDIDQNALWDFVDSPIAATFTDPSDQLAALDAPDEAARIVCDPDDLRSP